VVRILEPHDERALIDARRLAIALKVGAIIVGENISPDVGR